MCIRVFVWTCVFVRLCAMECEYGCTCVDVSLYGRVCVFVRPCMMESVCMCV